MAQQHVPDDKDGRFTFAEDLADGLSAHGKNIGVLHYTEAVVRAALQGARDAGAGHHGQETALQDCATAIVVATSNGRAWTTLARDNWKPKLGSRFNAAWTPAGFNGSLAVPSKPADLQPLLASLKTFLDKNPDFAIADPKTNVTAAQAETLRAALAKARRDYNAQAEKTTAAYELWQQQFAALRDCLGACIREVGDLLDDLDPRWIALGLNRPGDPDKPGVPERPRLESAGPGQLRATCDRAPRAEHYRWYKKVEGVDADTVSLPLTQDPQIILDHLPAGATVTMHVTAGNQGGDGPPSEEVSVKVA